MFKDRRIKCKAVTVLCLYLMQLFCYQDLIVAASDGHHACLKRSFSPFQHDSTNNSVISVFRTLEKHCDFGKEVSGKKKLALVVSSYSSSDQELSLRPILPCEYPLPLRLSDVSYRRYLMANVFRI
jgi:hypothetical protein